MCGIAGFVIRKPVDPRPIDSEKLLSELLHGIDHRGGDATGFVARSPGGMVEWHKASCDARQFVPSRRGMPMGADVALAHTRWATQGHQAFPENNHPLRRGSIYVVHNGIVTNDSELFRQVNRERYGSVDSEAIAAVLSHAGTLTESDATREALESIGGSAAIAALDERDGTILLARISGSPLIYLQTRRLIVWGSTEQAVCDAHERAVGSLGRAKPEAIAEGCAITIAGGEPVRWSFTPKPSPVRAYVPTPSTTGSYVPRDGHTFRFGEKWSWEDDSLVDGITGSKIANPPRPELVPAPASAPFPAPAPRRSAHNRSQFGYAVANGFSGDCELCGEWTDDLLDLYDGHDDWQLCEPCHDLATADMPRSLDDHR